MKKIIALLLCISFVFSLSACRKLENSPEGSKGESSEENGSSKGDAKAPSKTNPVAWSDSTAITEDMYVYYFNSYYRSFIEDYGASLSSMGLDPTQSLASQTYSETYTWHEYITLLVYNNLREMIALADAAKAAGLSVSDEDMQEYEAQLSEYEKLAKKDGMSLDEYIELIYGFGVTVDTMRRANELRYLGNAYYEYLWDGYNFTDEECLKYYEENRFAYLHFDCIKITVSKEDSKLLAAATDEESFVSAMRESVTKSNFLGDYETFSQYIEEQIQRKYVRRADYVSTAALSKWVAEDGRKPYDIHTKTESSGNVTVTMVLPAPNNNADSEVLYRDEQPLRNVKYIYFAQEEEKGAAKEKAEAVYDKWLSDPSEANFDTLISENQGGTSEDINRGDYASVLSDWIFDNNRKTGDCGVIDTSEGAYIIHMLEDGETSWIREVRDTLENMQYSEDVNSLIKKYPTEYNADFMYNLKEISLVFAGN